MGILLIFLALFIVVLAISIVVFAFVENEIASGVSAGGIFASAIGLFFISMFLFGIGIDYVGLENNRNKLNNQRTKLIRQLSEDYNSINLNQALDFNEKQKNTKYTQESFMWSYMNTNGAYVDTVVIPAGKFIPTQNINILTNDSSIIR